MGHADAWVMDIVLPAILLIVLIWLVIRVRSNRDDARNRRTEEGTRELYAEEEERRREGTDKL
jgi:membrane protein implicated in regulation of membrane protease activity